MTAISTIEDALCKIAADHDLTVVALSVSLDQISPDWRYSATVHWNGFSRDGNPCAPGYGPDIHTALVNALDCAQRDRTPPVMQLPEIPAEGVAA